MEVYFASRLFKTRVAAAKILREFATAEEIDDSEKRSLYWSAVSSLSAGRDHVRRCRTYGIAKHDGKIGVFFGSKYDDGEAVEMAKKFDRFATARLASLTKNEIREIHAGSAESIRESRVAGMVARYADPQYSSGINCNTETMEKFVLSVLRRSA